MTDGIDQIQDREWRVLHDRIAETLDRFGRRDAFGDGDYWLVDDNWGQCRHLIEIQNLNLLQPHIVKLLQRQLSDYPRWEIRVGVDTVKFDRKWPGMGLIVYSDQTNCRETICLPSFATFVTKAHVGPWIATRNLHRKKPSARSRGMTGPAGSAPASTNGHHAACLATSARYSHTTVAAASAVISAVS